MTSSGPWAARARVLGIVVNPVAGMGGRVGLHGTDGQVELARARGAEPVAPARARRALARLHELAPDLDVVVAPGALGADHLPDATGWRVTVLDGPEPGAETTADDTRAAVSALVAAGVDLLLFVGGDGTARDVAGAVWAVCDDCVPVLGVPAGVKMHSAVFGLTPETAALAASRHLAAPERHGTRQAEVVDRDAAGDVRLYGTVQVPALPAGVQPAKGAPAPLADDATALAAEVAAELEPGRLYLLGPGATVDQVGHALGLATTPLGVDAVCDGRLLAVDADEATLLDLLARHDRATLVLGVVGGQGFLLGRGNQQLSPAVLRALAAADPAGLAGILVLATPAKVGALPEPVLHVDLDDPELAAELAGYRRVRTAPGRSTVLRVET
ncbi:NAD(+)/NADH kinase [Nocardioides flavescens]